MSTARVPAALTALLSLLAVAACSGGGGDGAGDSGDGGGGGGVVVVRVDTGVAEGDADPGPVCTPGESVCLGETSWGICALDGAGYGATGECAKTAICDPQDGSCRVPICGPGEVQCIGLRKYRICNDLGTNWQPTPQSCGQANICYEGACQLCVPDRPFCRDTDTWAVCDAAGDGFVDPRACTGSTACHEFSGACRDPVCEPGALECTSGLSYHYCLPSGTGWDSEQLSCPKDFVCTEGSCVYKPCLPTVLLLVDRSGSMQGNWDEVQQSVVNVVEGNPEAQFGLMAFPFDGKCGVIAAPEIPIATHDAEVFQSWFDLHAPVGATPLTAAMLGVLTSSQLIFGAYRGAIILLSDGGETCDTWDVTDDLVTITTSLSEDKGIQTWVIGYKFTGDPVQLHAIATHGGTEQGTYIPAGNEAELTDAFQAVVNDFKQCSGR